MRACARLAGLSFFSEWTVFAQTYRHARGYRGYERLNIPRESPLPLPPHPSRSQKPTSSTRLFQSQGNQIGFTEENMSSEKGGSCGNLGRRPLGCTLEEESSSSCACYPATDERWTNSKDGCIVYYTPQSTFHGLTIVPRQSLKGVGNP